MIGLKTNYLLIYLIVVMNVLQINIVSANGKPPLAFASKLTSSYLYDSNIHRSHSGQISDNIVEMSPEVQFSARNKTASFRTKYDGTYTRYVNNALSDYLNTNLTVDAETNQEKSVSLNSKILYKTENESRGNVDISDEITNIQYATHAEYLVLGIKLQNSEKDTKLEGRISTIERRYNETDLEKLNSDYRSYRLKLSYRLTSRSDLFFAGERATYKYLRSEPASSENLESKYFFGGNWKISGKTSGIAEIGIQSKDLAASKSSKFTSIYTRMKMNWIKSSKSQFSLILKRQANDNPSGNGNYAVVNSLEVNWMQKFSHNFYTKTVTKSSVIRSTDEFENKSIQFEILPSLTYKITSKLDLNSNIAYKSNNTPISESKFYQLDFGIRYRINRLMETFVTTLWENRNSTQNSLNYSLMVTSFSFKLKY